jgi:DNA-binding MarR family transcriptional regulator
VPKPDLSVDVVTALRKIMRAVDLHSRSLVQQHGLTVPQLVLIREIGSGSRSLSDLSRNVNLSNATVTGIVDRLEKTGLVVRERSGSDRRQVMVHLTELGVSRLNSAPPLLQETFLTKLDSLKDWERAQILSVLQRVASMMQANGLDASPVLESQPLDIAKNSIIKPDDGSDASSHVSESGSKQRRSLG